MGGYIRAQASIGLSFAIKKIDSLIRENAIFESKEAVARGQEFLF